MINATSDCYDDPTITLSVSPREIRLMMQAMITADPILTRDLLAQSTLQGPVQGVPLEADLRAWDTVLDLVKDKALAM